jgi:hypothetical protein
MKPLPCPFDVGLKQRMPIERLFEGSRQGRSLEMAAEYGPDEPNRRIGWEIVDVHVLFEGGQRQWKDAVARESG